MGWQKAHQDVGSKEIGSHDILLPQFFKWWKRTTTQEVMSPPLEDRPWYDESIYKYDSCNSKLLGYMTESILVENIQFCNQGKDNLLQENIWCTIQKLLQDPFAHEKSKSQMEAILLIMWKQQDRLITIQTGGRKSMLWLIPPLLDPEAQFIVICPFTVLLD